jgi:hypothetical protein
MSNLKFLHIFPRTPNGAFDINSILRPQSDRHCASSPNHLNDSFGRLVGVDEAQNNTFEEDGETNKHTCVCRKDDMDQEPKADGSERSAYKQRLVWAGQSHHRDMPT